MRINIRGNDISPEKIAAALATCEKDYNLKITSATIYVRFENSSGQTVEPLQDGEEFSRDFWFQKKKAPYIPQPGTTKKPDSPVSPSEGITSGEMIRMCQQAAHRVLASPEMKVLMEIEKTTPISKNTFSQALLQAMQRDGGKFNIYTLRQLLVK